MHRLLCCISEIYGRNYYIVLNTPKTFPSITQESTIMGSMESFSG